MLVNCVSPPLLGTTTAVEHGQRTGFAHEAVVGMPVSPVDKPLAVAEFVAIFAGYDVHLAAVRMLRELLRTTGVPKIVMASRKATGAGTGRECTVPSCHARHAQHRSRRSIERQIEVKTADRRCHRRRQLFTTQGDGKAPRGFDGRKRLRLPARDCNSGARRRRTGFAAQQQGRGGGRPARFAGAPIWSAGSMRLLSGWP